MQLETEHARFRCAQLGQPVYIVEPLQGRPRATILFTHGLCEHGFRYLARAADWASKGLRTVFFHLDGHAVPGGEAERFLWLARAYFEENTAADVLSLVTRWQDENEGVDAALERDRYTRLRQTRMHQHRRQIRSIAQALSAHSADEEPSPLFLAGHSLGGLLSTEMGWRLGTEGGFGLCGVMLFSPALRAAPTPDGGWPESCAVKVGRAAHSHVLLKPVQWLVKGATSLGLKQSTAWASPYVSDLDNEAKLHEQDPLDQQVLPVRYLVAIQEQMAQTRQRAATYPVDVLMFVPTGDSVVDARGALNFARAMQAKNSSAECQLISFDGFGYHDVLRSSTGPRVSATVLEWLDEHVASAP